MEVLDDKWLPRLLQDPFGNYVIQTALGIADGQQFGVVKSSIHLCVCLCEMLNAESPFSLVLCLYFFLHFSQLVEGIRPHLNLIRHTPYGKKIEAKLTLMTPRWSQATLSSAPLTRVK